MSRRESLRRNFKRAGEIVSGAMMDALAVVCIKLGDENSNVEFEALVSGVRPRSAQGPGGFMEDMDPVVRWPRAGGAVPSRNHFIYLPHVDGGKWLEIKEIEFHPNDPQWKVTLKNPEERENF